MDAFKDFPKDKLAAHFHDTFDRAIPNILVAILNGYNIFHKNFKSIFKGITVVDSSVGGLGGCPYAKTSAGNVCTENIVFILA